MVPTRFMRGRYGAEALGAVLGALTASRGAAALDKQGSAHGGAVSSEEPDGGFDVSGALTLGVSVLNNSYAARPDNTGLVLMRYAGHADVDLIGRARSIPIDVNLFTDKTQHGPSVFAPTELDLITGVTTSRPLHAGGELELGTRVEHDRPVDHGFTQSYVDARARYLYSLAKVWPGLGRALVDGDINGFATLGWFAYNPTYAARPDNTGIALLRYAGHVELSVWHDYLSLGVDATMFTDRRATDPVSPTELDFTYDVIGHVAPWEVHLAYDRDMPLDTRSLVQDFVYVLLVYDFDLKRPAVAPLEPRGTIPSP